MQGQQINLKWKSFHSNILSSFEDLWEEEGLVDVTLASDGRCLKAHKIMLSASSPFFKKIFETNPCQHPVIVLQDVHYTELESILSFVYKGEVNILQENLPLLLRAAETLQIRGLCGQSAKEHNPDENSSEKMSTAKTPPLSPRNFKKMKSYHHNYRQPTSPPAAPVAIASVPVLPISPEEIKCEPRADSPAISDDRCDDPVGTLNLSQAKIPESDEDPKDVIPHPNECAYDLAQASKNFPFPPFPCPFCDRAYTSWGFRRRHIKACHTRSQRLPCKWCLEVLPSHTEWESHVCSKHSLSKSDARNGLLILEEAEVVLQIPQPTRLDALVTMIKEQRDSQSEDGATFVEEEETRNSQ